MNNQKQSNQSVRTLHIELIDHKTGMTYAEHSMLRLPKGSTDIDWVCKVFQRCPSNESILFIADISLSLARCRCIYVSPQVLIMGARAENKRIPDVRSFLDFLNGKDDIIYEPVNWNELKALEGLKP